jgi:hypothetical protein
MYIGEELCQDYMIVHKLIHGNYLTVIVIICGTLMDSIVRYICGAHLIL